MAPVEAIECAIECKRVKNHDGGGGGGGGISEIQF